MTLKYHWYSCRHPQSTFNSINTIQLQAILWNHDVQSYHRQNLEVVLRMAVVLGSLQIRYFQKQWHFDNPQVQLSEFSTQRRCREDHARSYTHKPQIIISAYMDEILKIQPCVEGGRLGPLRYFYDKISVHVCTFTCANSDILTINKLNYLNSLLKGDAARTVQGLTLTSSNYDATVEMLQEHYGKPQIIISVYMDEILKI